MPKVSVIIPTFNCASYIVESIDSVLAQTYKNLEIIVIDDGSSDDTNKVLEPYINSQKIRYFYQKNKGLSAARNNGLKLALGKFIKFLDSDDLLYPDQIEKQFSDIEFDKNVLSMTDCMVLKPNGKKEHRKAYLVKKEFQLASFIESNRGVVHAFLIPKEIIEHVGGFDETLKSCEDLDLWIRILRTGAYIKPIPYPGCYYRILNTSMSMDLENMFLQKCKVYEKLNLSLLNDVVLPQMIIDSSLIINTKLIEECMLRKIDLEKTLPITLKISTLLYNSKKRGLLKFVFKSLKIRKYIKLRYFIKRLKDSNYRSKILNVENEWKFQ